jgi:NAD kinase
MTTWENIALFPDLAPSQVGGGENLFTEAAYATTSDLASLDKIVVVTRKTPLEDLVLRLNSKSQARFYLEQNNVSFEEYEQADLQYQRALQSVKQQLPRQLKTQFLDRDLLPTYQFGERDLVITLGQDGLVVNVAKYLTTQPILALNPDPKRLDGVLIPFAYSELQKWLERTLQGKVKVTNISMARAVLNDGQVLYAVNDLFIGMRSHGSARYLLELNGRSEQQSSSGLIVSTGAGCTGWFRSITTGAWRIAQYFGGVTDDLSSPEVLSLGWDSELLWFSVREPFISKTSRADLVFGQLERGQKIVLTSQMPDAGIIFSDGIESDYLAFNSGTTVEISLAARQAHLITRS